jgi:predicted lactoylglutathione lyase
MTQPAPRLLFVNLAVKDLKASMAFFEKLGMTFNPQFTDDTAACMVVSEQAFFMLLTHDKMKTFTHAKLCDTTTHTEGLFAFSCHSRDEVDSVLQAAFDNGAQPAMPKQDHGFMVSGSFYDLDHHHWEVMWMDPAAMQG